LENINIKLDIFEGPFDLLFYLIEKNKIDLYNIPISELTDQYIKYIENPENKNMSNISEFIFMASTLLEIKSKMLLPKSKFKDDEIDPREELVQKLIEYKRYKKVADIFKGHEIFINKVAFKEPEISLIEFLIKDKMVKAEDTLGDITLDLLKKTFLDVMNRKEMKIDRVRSSFDTVSKDSFTIETQIVYITEFLKNADEIYFSEIFYETTSRDEIIATFLALLEMIKLKMIKIIQRNPLEEILIKSIEYASVQR